MRELLRHDTTLIKHSPNHLPGNNYYSTILQQLSTSSLVPLALYHH